MKYVAVILALVVPICAFAKPYVRRIGEVQVWRNWMMHKNEPRPSDGATYLEIRSWKSASLPANIDSAFFYARRDSTFRQSNISPVIFLMVPACSDEDSACVMEIAGRFAPEGLRHIQPTGTWQWAGPLAITVADTARCPLFEQLQERRWTVVQVIDEHYDMKSANDIVGDLLRRWKRERKAMRKQVEEENRKQESGE